jgi:hypothetical protein
VIGRWTANVLDLQPARLMSAAGRSGPAARCHIHYFDGELVRREGWRALDPGHGRRRSVATWYLRRSPTRSRQY